MKYLLLLTLLSLPLAAQSPDRWRGLIIDESTPENAMTILGTPNADKTDSFRVYKIEDWLTKSIREKKWRRLEYKNVEGFDKVILAFDTKLVFIELNPKKLDPDVLENAYGVSFTMTADKFIRAMEPGRISNETGRTRSFPSFYYLYAKPEKTFILASVANTSFGAMLGAKSINDDVGFPGKVTILQIISRTLENRDGVEILK